MTFDVTADVLIRITYDWQAHHEVFGVCRNCLQPTIWAITQKDYDNSKFLSKNPSLAKIEDSLNRYFEIKGYICLKDMGVMDAPEDLGMPGYRFAVIGHPISSASDAQLAEYARSTIEQARRLLMIS